MSVTGRLMVNYMFKAMKSNRLIMATRLHIRTSPAEVKSYFENYGPVAQVYRNIDVNLGVYHGPAYVQFEKEETSTNVKMQRQHFIDDQEIELYNCDYFPRELSNNLQKNSEKEQK